MISDLDAAVTAFRLGREAEGSQNLVAFIDSLLGALGRGAQLSGNRVLPLVQDLISAKERGDYLRVADVLQYELRDTVAAMDSSG